jgi:GTP-binding protein HflX
LIEKKIKKSPGAQEKAVLVGIITRNQPEELLEEYLEELRFLAVTAGATPLRCFIQKLDRPDPRTFIGAGKLTEIKNYVTEHEVDMVIFDDELSPSQLRNLEKSLEVKILDRNNLILDIFAARARTSYARTQVELAQYEYLLPRLTRMWTHLQKQRGGIGMKGPGEKEIETDRRIVRDRIANLKDKLRSIDRQMSTQRQNRGEFIRVALVGYTNVGKSTIMNLLSKSEVLAENKLFATLDTTVRKVVIENIPFLLSDTVGFIRKLPTQLIESFKSTLDEVREADLLLHVVDISHPSFEAQIAIVRQTLREIGAGEKPQILIFNKVDAYKNPDAPVEGEILEEDAPFETRLQRLKRTWMSALGSPCIFISATEKNNVTEFREVLAAEVRRLQMVRYPHNRFLY